MKGNQGDTKWNGAIHEKLCIPSRASPPLNQEKRKAEGNSKRKKEGAGKSQAVSHVVLTGQRAFSMLALCSSATLLHAFTSLTFFLVLL